MHNNKKRGQGFEGEWGGVYGGFGEREGRNVIKL